MRPYITEEVKQAIFNELKEKELDLTPSQLIDKILKEHFDL